MTSQPMGGPSDEFLLPDVGEGLDSAEIVEWLVGEGETVERDQPLVEILTDKSQTQLPSPKAGVIKRLGFAEGDMAEVGQVPADHVPGLRRENSVCPPSAVQDTAMRLEAGVDRAQLESDLESLQDLEAIERPK